MSSCLSGGTGRAYGFDLENIVKTSSTSSSRNSNSSSPSSTLSESSNSPLAISTRKPRTPRKRPNQIYNEAAALLSSACPTIFSITKKHNKQSELPKNKTYFFNEPPELLLPFPVSKRPIKLKPKEVEFHESWICSPSSNSFELSEGYQDDFDTESMLDEETEEGIDSIMGNSNSIVGGDEIPNVNSCLHLNLDYNYNTCYGYPLGLGFGGNLEFNFGFGLRNGVRALRNVNEGNSWSFPAINVMNISPPASMKSKKAPVEKKKKVEELMKLEPKIGNPVVVDKNSSLENGPRLLLKLNYDKVLDAWSDKGSPLPEELSGSESPGNDIHARLAQIDLFSDNGGIREASVIRYKEKRRSRLFSKKIRYQVRKVNADRRPRSKGRFVRRPDSPNCEET